MPVILPIPRKRGRGSPHGRWVTVQEVTIVSRPMRLPLPGLLLVVALTAPGCDEPEAVTPPPTEVSVVEVSAGRLEEVHEFTGNVEASRSRSEERRGGERDAAIGRQRHGH